MFGQTIANYRQHLVADTVEHVHSARAGSTNDKIREPERRDRGFGGFTEMCKRLLIASDKPGAVKLPTARARRLARVKARKAETREKAAARRKRGKRGRR